MFCSAESFVSSLALKELAWLRTSPSRFPAADLGSPEPLAQTLLDQVDGVVDVPARRASVEDGDPEHEPPVHHRR